MVPNKRVSVNHLGEDDIRSSHHNQWYPQETARATGPEKKQRCCHRGKHPGMGHEANRDGKQQKQVRQHDHLNNLQQ